MRCLVSTPRNPRRLAFRMIVGVIVLFLAFETAVRLLPPDGARVTRIIVTQDGVRHIDTVSYITPQDMRDIAKLAAFLNNQGVTSPIALSPCNAMTPAVTNEQETVVFQWHGWTTQVWTLQNCSPWYRNSGGVPDPWGRQ